MKATSFEVAFYLYSIRISKLFYIKNIGLMVKIGNDF